MLNGWFVVVSAALAGAPAASPFDDAIAAWHLANLEDAAGAKSALKTVGAVKVGVGLEGAEAVDSKKRGGDGKVAVLEGGWLDAGQGAIGELNLPGGSAMSLLIRLRDPTGTWDSSLLAKRGSHEALIYNLFTVNLGGGMALGFELGTERGMVQVKAPLSELGDPAAWHDVIVRYDGKRLELFVDGVAFDIRPATGSLRSKNREPCIVGGEANGGKVSRPFRGSIDHAALWNRALADGEVASLSGGEAEIEARKKALQSGRVEREKALFTKLASDPQRPRYHFVPPAHWMNDPNGLAHWKGEYHLFYQHNPNGAFWGTMHWGHAKSKDLVHWEHLPIALAPTPGGPDWDGVFSGCLVDNGGVPTIVYTGVSPETQCIATSRDGLLTWEKHPANPVIPKPPEGLQVTGFRDPYVWKESDGWHAVVGSGIRGAGGAALLYRSPDLVHWEYLHPLCLGKKEHGEMWECPNFFPLGGKHVLLVAVHGTTLYFTGRYEDHRFTPEVEGSTDHGGRFYAAQCFADARGRRILFGWVTEARSDAAQRASGWSGAQSLPRLLTLLPDGKLGMEPMEEVKLLKKRRVADLAAPLKNRLEILSEYEPGDAEEVGLMLRDSDDQVRATITYQKKEERIRLQQDGPQPATRVAPFKLAPDEPLKLHVFLDGSVLEVFAGGRVCFTSRIEFPRADRITFGGVFAPREPKRTTVEIWEIEE